MSKHLALRWRPTGEEQNRIGRDAEIRFLAICEEAQRNGNYPFWLIKIEPSTKEDDAQGIDAWAITDQGRIPIQIKRSTMLKTLFQQRIERSHIICIVCHPSMRPVSIFQFLLSQLLQKKKRMMTTIP